MPDVIRDTSSLQYLYQLNLLHILPALSEQVIVPPAVLEELVVGRAQNVSLPDVTRLDWVSVRRPTSEPALPLITDLGPGETQVLMLALESRAAVVVLDAKRAGLVLAVAPLLDKLQVLCLRLAPHTRAAVLKLAGEEP